MEIDQTKVDAVKRHLANTIIQQFKDSGSTAVGLAKFVGMTEPRMSNLMKGKLHKFSIDMLVMILLKMESDVTFTVEWKGDYPWLKK